MRSTRTGHTVAVHPTRRKFMATEAAPALDEAKIGEFVNQVLGELGATANAALVVIGDKLGLYEAMSEAGPITPSELAERTGTAERYVREWLNAQAAGGYVSYDSRTQRYTLPPEQACALADEQSPVFLPGRLPGHGRRCP